MTEAQILALEIFFVGLIAAAALAVTWIAFITISRLYKGQR